MKHRLIATALLAATAAGSLPVLAQTAAPFVGQWRWNRAESTTAPSEALPSDVVLAITAASAAQVQWTLTGTDAKGGKHVQNYSGSGDGRPGPVGGAPDGTMASFTVTPTAMTASYSNKDGSSERTSCSLSPDGRKMTCQGTDVDTKGRSTAFRDVYDRQ